ncbi:MAG: glycosyltransferase [Candidatus Nanohaloarchaea archaeon]
MKIGFFTDSYFPEIDGVTYTLESWKERLEDRGHEVYIVYPESSRHEPGEREIPVPAVPNPFYNGYNVSPPMGFDRFPELDVVHCHSPFGIGRAGKLYADRHGIPAVYTHHTPVEDYLEQNTHSKIMADIIARSYLPLENRFLRGFDRVTASTESIDREVEPVKLPVGVDTEFFSPTESFLDGLGLERPLVGYSGRLSIEKNVDQVLEMAREVEGTVIIVGEGPKKEELESMAPENVVFMDFLPREDLPGFYSGLDVFVTASTGDTLGLSTLEANACGTPVVAADTHPFDQTIKRENGLRFTPGEPEEMRKKVEECLENDFSTREAVERYSLKKTVEQLEELYLQIQG